MIVRELITRLGFNLDQGGINRAEAATNRLRYRANETANAFRNVFAGLIGIASIKSLVQTADTMQSIRARIEQLPQTVMAAGEAFDIVADRASAARAPIEAYAGLYNRLGNAAKAYITTQEDLLGITDTISKALVVGGATAQEAGSVMIQFSQALGAGTLQGEEFRAMAEAAPQFMDKLSEALGIPREQLKKMASEGKITSKQVIEATRQMAEYFDLKFRQMPMTVGQAMTVVGNRFSKMIDRMNRESMLITNIANVILRVFDQIEKGVDFVVEKFDGWSNALRYIGIALAVAFGAKAIALLVTFGATAGIALIKFALIAGAILLVAALIEDFVVWLEGGDSIIGRMLEKFNQWADAISNAISEGLANAERAVLETIMGWSDALYRMFVETIPKAIRDAFNYVTELPSVAWEGLKQGASNIASGAGMGFNGVSPSSMASGNRALNVTNATNVSVTVPPGTTAEQAAFLERSAQASFNKASGNLDPLAMGAYAQ